MWTLPYAIVNFCKIIKYVVNLNLKKENTIVSKAYKHLCYLDSIGCLTWVQHVKNILKNVGINISDLSIVDVKLYNDFKCRIYEQYMASWKQSISDIEVHPILRTYYLFKDDFCLESYLININDYVGRKSLSKLGMSSHSLEIEIGRHKNHKDL